MLVRTAVTYTLLSAIVGSASLAQAQTAATPQTLTPTPLPPAAGADTPGGAARNGVIAPPAPSADSAINRGAPAPTVGTPIIPPPGSPGGNPAVVPK